MLEFVPILPTDRPIITAYTFPSSRRNCDMSFANLCSWRFLFQTCYTTWRDFLLIKFEIEGRQVYMLPVGGDNLSEAIDVLADDAHAHGQRLTMAGVCEDMVEEINRRMPGRFDFEADRNYADYVYRRADLSSLAGRHLQPKRNHANRFRHLHPDYQYVSLSPAHIDECLELEAAWYAANPAHRHIGTDNERRSLTFALTHFEALGLTGGLLRTEGRAVAFTFGSPIGRDTFGVHVEKADVSVEGAYAAINQEFVSRLPERFVYVNREEDLGIEGLRRAKLSYQPAIILFKYLATEHE